MDKEKDSLFTALRKKAYGYTVKEQATEYDESGNVVKNKVTTKDVPPDLSAIKMLLDSAEDDELTESQLEEERERLLGLLRKTQSKRGKHGNQKV